MSYDEYHFEKALIGERVIVMPPLKVPHITETAEVQHARKRGWEAFMRKTFILPDDKMYLDPENKGIYFRTHRKTLLIISSRPTRLILRRH